MMMMMAVFCRRWKKCRMFSRSWELTQRSRSCVEIDACWCHARCTMVSQCWERRQDYDRPGIGRFILALSFSVAIIAETGSLRVVMTRHTEVEAALVVITVFSLALLTLLFILKWDDIVYSCRKTVRDHILLLL